MSIKVGHEIAIYKCDQESTKLAIAGKIITPIDQNCSNKVIMMVFGFPSVMSATNKKSEVS